MNPIVSYKLQTQETIERNEQGDEIHKDNFLIDFIGANNEPTVFSTTFREKETLSELDKDLNPKVIEEYHWISNVMPIDGLPSSKQNYQVPLAVYRDIRVNKDTSITYEDYLAASDNYRKLVSSDNKDSESKEDKRKRQAFHSMLTMCVRGEVLNHNNRILIEREKITRTVNRPSEEKGVNESITYRRSGKRYLVAKNETDSLENAKYGYGYTTSDGQHHIVFIRDIDMKHHIKKYKNIHCQDKHLLALYFLVHLLQTSFEKHCPM